MSKSTTTVIPPTGQARPDPLGEALHVLRMSGAFYSPSELTAPWGMYLPPMPDHLWFHVVLNGGAWVEPEGADAERIEAGRLVILPQGRGHRLFSDTDCPTPSILDLPEIDLHAQYSRLSLGGGGESTTAVCGAVRLDHPAAKSLIGVLPPLMTVDVSDPSHADWVHSILRLMAAELRSPRPGGEAVVTRLCDILVIQSIRVWLDADPVARSGWLGALHDPQIGHAVALIHRHPDASWTVGGLASEVAMSRSAFSARFSELVGEPVMSYVTTWRMHVARLWIEDEQLTVAQTANRLGYQSEAAFSRAFKRTTGASPGEVRRAARDRAA